MASPVAGEVHVWWCMVVVLVVMMRGQTREVCPAVAAAFCGLVLVFGSKLVSYDAASLPFGMVSEPRRRLDPTPAGSLVVFGHRRRSRLAGTARETLPKPDKYISKPKPPNSLPGSDLAFSSAH